MKRIVLVAAVIVLFAFSFTGCALRVSPVANTVDISNLDLTTVKDMKYETVCSYYIFGLIGPFGNPSLSRITEAKKAKLLEYEHNFWILWSSDCVGVRFE